MECTLNFAQLPTGEKFILAFGLGGIEAGMGERQNIEVTFTNKGGIQVGVIAYEDYDAPTTVCSAKAAGIAMNAAANVKVEIGTDQSIRVYVNNNKVCSGKLPVNGEGRIGFLQTGRCAVEVTNLKLTYYQYDRPENTNIEEDFKEDGLNIAVLSGKTLSGSKTMTFESYKDNGVLMFKGVGQTYVGTRYSYSNFEMSFDVPYLELDTTINEDGEPIDGTGSIGISFGSGKVSQEKNGYEKALDTVVLRQGSVYSQKKPEEFTAENPYWQKQKAFSMKVSLIDNVVTVAGKWLGEKSYNTLLSYSLGSGISTGCVHLWVMDQGNFAIDNLVIKNMDDTPGLMEKEFKNGKIVAPEDAEYIPFERVYATDSQEANATTDTRINFSWYLCIPTAALVGVFAIILTAWLSQAKGKKKKEGTSDEK